MSAPARSEPLAETSPVEVVTAGLMQRRYVFKRGAEDVARLDLSWWRERGVLSTGGHSFTIRRTRAPGRPFVLEREGQEVARAEKPSAFRSRFVLFLGDERCELRKPHVLSRAFVLYRGEHAVGEIAKKGLTGRRATLDLPDAWPLPLQAFVFFLARIVWNREQSAS